MARSNNQEIIIAFIAFIRQDLGISKYVYCPPYDDKAGMRWRLRYKPEELDQLKTKIAVAHLASVDFLFALRPGQNVIRGTAKDSMMLLDKVNQVNSIGCSRYALLFDDVTDEMLEAAGGDGMAAFIAQMARVANSIVREMRYDTKVYDCDHVKRNDVLQMEKALNNRLLSFILIHNTLAMKFYIIQKVGLYYNY